MCYRNSPRLVPNAILDFGRQRHPEGEFPARRELCSIVGMHRAQGTFLVERFRFAEAGQLEPVIVDPFEPSVGVTRPDDLRQRVRERAVGAVAGRPQSS